MGEYFCWVNVDKKEYLCPNDFDQGNKCRETVHRENPLLNALYELLSDEWSGDRVMFLGDECDLAEKPEYEILRSLTDGINHYEKSNYFDTMVENYRNVSCLFEAAEEDVRPEILRYIEDLKLGNASINEYGVKTESPMEGLFCRKGMTFRYIINHTKKLYYSCALTKILYMDRTESHHVDPLPVLLGCGRSVETGLWVGDCISAADEVDDTYILLEEISLDW